jgi:hypothetical protein
LTARPWDENEQEPRDQDETGDARKADETSAATTNIDGCQSLQNDGGKTDFGRMTPHTLMGRLRGWAIRIVGISVIGSDSEVVVHSHNQAG